MADNMKENMKWSFLAAASFMAVLQTATTSRLSVVDGFVQSNHAGQGNVGMKSGLLRLRGGALYGASLTRWQHSDPTITEV
jgi:hypothetical protein